MKLRFLPALLAIFAALLVAGCGGSGGGGGTDPATIAPAKTPLYVDFTIHPEGEQKANVEALAQKLAGIDDLGGLIVSKLEESASGKGEEVDFQKEVEPWLGERAGFIYPKFEAGQLNDFAAAIQVTDAGEAEAFVDKHVESGSEKFTDGSFEGVDYRVGEDGTTIGVIDELLVIGVEERVFKEVVTASEGESLADESAYTDAVSNVPPDSAADVYVDIGGVIAEAEAGGEVDRSTKLFFEDLGVELDEATAVASLVPGSDQAEIDISSNAIGANAPSGDASKLLESLPADSVAALASAEFGKRFNEGIDQIDEQGIPGQVPPHQLKKALKEAGIDLESIAASIGDAGVFVEGNSERNLTGAMVLATDSASQAKNTVSNIGLFLRASGLPGVTAVNGKASGFSIRSAELGREPIVVVAKGERIAIGYGLEAALAGLEEAGETLADSPAYKEAVDALGDTPISAFVDGPAALKLASALVPPGEEGFREAKRYLTKVDYLALGSEASDGLATARLIVGVGK
ncbi:MAG TPA: DUF3352 domain-containing protein [Solirubrobacterales bacterium]|nr:DUF3352 domain-containing protein [Solirubrobacterales bacterium]